MNWLRGPRRATGHGREAIVLIVLIGAMAAPSAIAASTSATDFTLKLSSSRPKNSTGASLYILYKKPGDPGAKPSALTRVVIGLPAGGHYDGNAVPYCTASDQELMAIGAAACPVVSNVGGGRVTALTGFGPPSDPVSFNATFFNAPGGLVLMLSQPQTGATMLVTHGKFTAPGTLSFDPIPTVPGGPPDFKTAVREVSVHLNNAGSSPRPFITTPPRCPASHEWISQLQYSTADGNSYSAQSSTPCSARSDSGGRPRHGAPARIDTHSRRNRTTRRDALSSIGTPLGDS